MMTLKDKIIVYGGLACIWIAGIVSNLIYWQSLS